MAGFLYFVSGDGVITRQRAIRAGLGYALAGGCPFAQCMNGPDGKRGGILSAVDALGSSDLGYFPDKQTWQRIPGTDAYAGFYTDDPPTPKDVAKPSQIAGHLVALGDGNEWLVPVARGLVEEDGDLRYRIDLPDRTTLDDDGNWITSGVATEFQALWSTAEKWWEAIGSADGKPVTYTDLHDDALAALSTNYRIGKAECALLGLLNTQICRGILDALVDVPTYMAWVKKKAAQGGASSSDGPTD